MLVYEINFCLKSDSIILIKLGLLFYIERNVIINIFTQFVCISIEFMVLYLHDYNIIRKSLYKLIELFK